jgi:hypothetical protein
MPLQLDKLRLSSRQKFVPNNGLDTENWPNLYFWTEGLILLDDAQIILKLLDKLGADVKANFWRGNMPAQLLNVLPARLANNSPARIIEYCRVWESQERARLMLIVKAGREKLDSKGTLSLGDIRLDERTFALRMAAHHKAVDLLLLPYFINRAAEQNDVRFFIRLGKVLQSKHLPKGVDWTRCDPLASFIVQNWCEERDFRTGLPTLCLFTDQALADFCSVAFGRKPGTPSAEAIRQWRRRLGLKQVRRPKVRKVILKGDEILLA